MLSLPSPQECGLPEHFTSWRPKQEEAIDIMLHSPKRVKAICAPTGSGKSLSLMTAAVLSGLPTCIVTASRGLQDQMLNDFKSIGLVDIRGRRNYECDMREGYTCEDGYAARCPYKGTANCPSSVAERRAAASPLVITNYDKWIASRKYGLGMSHFQQVIFDESHLAPEALARAMQVELNHHEVEDTLKVPFPAGAHAEDMNTWKVWANHTKKVADREMVKAHDRLEGHDPKPSWVRHYNHMCNLVRRLAVLATARATDWIADDLYVKGERAGYVFDPIRPGRYAESALLMRIQSVIITSATLRPKTLFMIGIGKDNFEFKEFDSDFDPKRCPIYYIPTMRVDSKADDLGPLWLRLDQIASRRRDRKGIIHTVSYARQEDIMATSRWASSMLINPRGEAPTGMIDQFRESGDGTILVSPSIGMGYDFPGRDCEWQFMCKIPFAPPSKILKAREAEDPEYRSYQAMQDLVQAFGRGMRSKSDSCENFIGDAHLEWFLPRYGHLAPRSFHGFFKTIRTLPPPPERVAA